MSFEFFIGCRYLRTRRRQAFISLINMLSIAGVTIGVMTLIVVIAVMTGTEYDLKTKLLADQPHVLIMQHGGGFSKYRDMIKYIKQIEGVKSVTPFVYSQIMLRSKSGISGAVLKGICADPSGINSFERASLNLLSEKRDDAIPKIVLGKALASELRVEKGDMLIYMGFSKNENISIDRMPAMRRFEVAGTFDSGLYEFNKAFTCIKIEDAQKILSMGNTITGIEVRLNEVFKAGAMAEKLRKILGYPYWTRDWTRINQSLFSSLKLQKIVMFIILTLIVLVAAFSITSALIMMVIEKTKDIAILKTMGATNKSIAKIFIFKGMAIGIIGTLFGTLLGFILCAMLRRYKFIELPETVYPFTTIPVKLDIPDVLIIVASALILCLLATIYPARRASKLDPVDGIRKG